MKKYATQIIIVLSVVMVATFLIATTPATYSYNEYLPERKEALELWSKKIEDLVSASDTKNIDKAIK